jgi:hypothetical protein
MILLVLLLILLPFAVVLLFGAPYLPTRKEQAEEALDLLDLKPGEVFVDLGCGDGVMLVHGAKRGLICYGYELNPFVWLVAYVRTFRYRKTVKVKLGNFWKIQLPKGTKGVYVFLLDKYMSQLNEKLTKELKGGRLLSYTFKIPGKKAISSKRAMNLYKY